MIPANDAHVPAEHERLGFRRNSGCGAVFTFSGKMLQQLPDIYVKFCTAGGFYRCVQANDQIAGRQVFALPPKNIAGDAFEQVTPAGMFNQLFGHRHAQAGGIQIIGTIVKSVEAATERAPKSKNG